MQREGSWAAIIVYVLDIIKPKLQKLGAQSNFPVTHPEIRIQYSAVPGDECYIARVVEWPTISAHGDTPAEAARQIQLALEGALEVAGETGFPIPAPAALAKG